MGPVRKTVQDDRGNGIDLLEQVEAELARRQQNSDENLGPSDLNALLARNQEEEPVSRQRVPATRGGGFSRGGGGRRGGVAARPQDIEDVGAVEPSRQTSRGRLQVLENSRPPLQRFEEDLSEFDNFNIERQRNRG